MGKILSNSTADRLMYALDKMGRSSVSPSIDPRDQGGRPPADGSLDPDPSKQRIKSVQYTYDSAGGHAPDGYEGILQDYEAFKRLITDNDVCNYNGDLAIPFLNYDISATAATIKDYAAIDSHNYTDWADRGASLQFYIGASGQYLQIYNWFANGTLIVPTSYSDFAPETNYDAGYTLVMRDNTDKVLKYCSLLNFKAVDADHADTSDTADSCNTADEAGTITGNHPHVNHDFSYDDHDGTEGGGTTTWGIAKYLILNGDSARNNMSGELGDSSNALVMDPSARTLHMANEDVSVDFGNLELSGGNWNMDDQCSLEGAAGGGSYFILNQDYIAAHFEAGTGGDRQVTLCDGSQCGLFDNVEYSISVILANDARAVDAVEGPINANSTSGFTCAGTKVLGAQQSAIADIGDTSGSDNDGTARSKINTILAMLRTHGIIAT